MARQGGDEFLMLLADLHNDDVHDAVQAVVERVYEALDDPFELQGANSTRADRWGSACTRRTRSTPRSS